MPRALAATLPILLFLVKPAALRAQQADPAAQTPPSQETSPAPASNSTPPPSAAPHAPDFSHRFWDRENDLLFGGVAGARTLDYFSTLNMRSRGRQEILLTDWAVDHHGVFIGIEASGVALSVGVAYAFHRTGHHKLERWVSIVHIGVGTGGAIRNYCLKTAHVAP